MGEKGAHLTGTAQVKPTIFELVAQQSLASTLEPAFKNIFHFLIDCNLERYGWLGSWDDEVFLVFHGILQNFYLKNYSASFSETFYSLKRVTLSNGKLTNRQKQLFLVFLIVFPYVEAKVRKCQLNDFESHKQKWKAHLRKLFVKVCQTFSSINDILSIFYYLSYMSNYTIYPNQLFHLLSSTLTYSNSKNIISISELLYNWKRSNFSTNQGVIFIQTGIVRIIELGAFVLQFINWWNRENNYLSVTSLPAPPPPVIPEEAKKYKSLCPVCLQRPSIPTALSVSGYVFCYQCILPIVQNEKHCPVTNCPVKEDDLIRIYKN